VCRVPLVYRAKDPLLLSDPPPPGPRCKTGPWSVINVVCVHMKSIQFSPQFFEVVRKRGFSFTRRWVSRRVLGSIIVISWRILSYHHRR
jgi:hypothetical protein